MHVRAIGIEDPRHSYVEFVLSAIVVEQRLSAAFAFIVAGPRVGDVHETAVVFRLRMRFGIAINFAGRSLEDTCVQALRKPQHVNRSDHACLCRLNRIVLVVNRGGGAGEIVDFVDFHVEPKRNVMPHHFERWVVHEPRQIVPLARKIVVDTEDIAPLGEQFGAQIRTQKSGAARHENTAFSWFFFWALHEDSWGSA